MTAIPQNAPLVYITFSADINPLTTETLIANLTNCANAQVKNVYLAISTPGGQVANGLNLYNVLRGMPFELTTHNVGNIDSVGNAVFLAGAKRYANANTSFMFHGVGFPTPPNIRLLQEKECREFLDGILLTSS
jgi:ATP-dependent protease ClpP protease subunit